MHSHIMTIRVYVKLLRKTQNSRLKRLLVSLMILRMR